MRAGQRSVLRTDTVVTVVRGLSVASPRGLTAALAFAAMVQAPVNAASAREFAAIVIDAGSGDVLYQHEPDDIRHPASLTKMMTLYLTFEALENGQISLADRLPVSDHAQSMSPTKLGVRAGQTLLVENAVMGLITKSANDAAVVLAEALGGSEPAFAQKMTQKARALGMSHTVFHNASGLPDDEQVTTARDLATLSLALIKDHSQYYRLFSTRTFNYCGRPLRNHNHLMERYAGMDGIKTGYIAASGFNLAASAVRDGHRLVGVVIGGKTAVARDNQMASLLDSAFAQFRRSEPNAPLVASAPPPIKVAATEETPLPKADKHGKVSKPRATAQNRTIAQLAAATAGNWGVQIGAYPTKHGGQQALDRASRRLPRNVVDDVTGSVSSSATRKGKVFRARFTGLSEKEARALCTSLKRAGESCVAVAPSARGL